MHKNHEDLVSVILPVYNGEEFLSQAIESITAQTHRNIEIIILDDGSTDRSKSIALDHAKNDPRISVITRENKGLGATLNELISSSNSEYIARMDADDICFPERISEQLAFMKKNPDCVIVGGQIEFIIGSSTIEAFPMPTMHNEIKEGLLEARFPICHPAIMFKKSIATKVGGYLVSGAGEDLDFFLRMSEAGTISNTPTKSLKYRIQTNSLSIKKAKELNKAYSLALHNARLRKKNLPEITISQFERDYWEARSILARAKEIAHNLSEILYRKSIIKKSKNKKISSTIILASAAILRPKTSIKRISQKIRQNTTKHYFPSQL